MIVNFFDSENIASLYPLTLTRPAADLRVGICTIAEKWNIRLSANQFGYITSEHLSKKFTNESKICGT